MSNNDETLIARADTATLLYASLFTLTFLLGVVMTPGLVYGERGVVGGDFLAFYTAGQFALSGEALAAYDLDAFDAAMKARAPAEVLAMMWQYPPAMFFLAAPFALIPYKISLLCWLAAGWAFLGYALSRFGFTGRGWRLLVLSPICVIILSHGQISYATTALFLIAVWKPREHWLLAGLAAGALTLKPQLGLVIPAAYLAIGAWRTIGVAMATSFMIHAASVAAFGLSGWRAFIDAVFRLNADISGAATLTPPRGMTTPFGQLKLMGVPGDIASLVQYGATAMLVAATFVVWRMKIEPLGKVAFAGAAAVLAAPYAYGYEMTLLLAAGAFLAAHATSLQSRVGIYLVAVWIIFAAKPVLPALPMFNLSFGLSVSALVMVAMTIGGNRSGVAHAPAPA